MFENKNNNKQNREQKRNQGCDPINKKPIPVCETKIIIAFIQTPRVILPAKYEIINPANKRPNYNSF